MSQIKPYLPVVCSLVMAVTLFTADSTLYRNPANEVDYAKAVAAFVTLFGLFTGFFKMNPPGAE
jgi:hypothetical protein